MAETFLLAAQIMLLSVNILAIGFMTASGISNVLGAQQFMQSAATRRSGDNSTADVILQIATDTNNLCNKYEGVSKPPPSFHRRRRLAAANTTRPRHVQQQRC